MAKYIISLIPLPLLNVYILNTLMVLILALFEQNRENLYREIQFFQKISENCMKTRICTKFQWIREN